MKTRNGFVSNSSSSSFVCKTDLTVKEVKTELKLMLAYLSNIMGIRYDFETLFGAVVKVDKEAVNGPESDYVKDRNDYWRRDFFDRSIIIRSDGDNTIPYWMFSVIEEKFNAIRIHRG